MNGIRDKIEEVEELLMEMKGARDDFGSEQKRSNVRCGVSREGERGNGRTEKRNGGKTGITRRRS